MIEKLRIGRSKMKQSKFIVKHTVYNMFITFEILQ